MSLLDRWREIAEELGRPNGAETGHEADRGGAMKERQRTTERSDDAVDDVRAAPMAVEDPNGIGERAVGRHDDRRAPSEEDLSSKTEFEGLRDPTANGGDQTGFDPHELDLGPGIGDGTFAGDVEHADDPFGLDVDGDALAAETHGGVPEVPQPMDPLGDGTLSGPTTDVPAEYSLAGNETGQTMANPAPPGHVMLSTGDIVPEGSPAATADGDNGTSLLGQRFDAVGAGAIDDDGSDDDTGDGGDAGTPLPGATGTAPPDEETDDEEGESLGVVTVGGTGVMDALEAMFTDDDPEQRNTEKAAEVQQQKEQEQQDPAGGDGDPTDPQGTDGTGTAETTDTADEPPPDDPSGSAEDYGEGSQTFGRSPSMDDEIGETYFDIQHGAIATSEIQYGDQPTSASAGPLEYDGIDYGDEELEPVEDLPAEIVTQSLYTGGDIDPAEADASGSFTGADDSADATMEAAEPSGDAGDLMDA